MERILKGDEKIRKAEEIYYRRKLGVPSNSRKYDETLKRYLGSKICLQILIILNLSVVVLAVQNKDYIFTENFLMNVSEYNINLTKSIRSLIGIEEMQEEIPQENVENVENQVVVENKTTNEIVPNNEAISSLNQMDLDIENIKKSYSFFKPIEGTVTSLFGARESKYQNVTGYHTGIDVGAEKGTSIKAAVSRDSDFSIK